MAGNGDTPDNDLATPDRPVTSEVSNAGDDLNNGKTPQATAGETQADLELAMVEFEQKIAHLPPRQRLIALLGFTKNVEAKFLPDCFKAIQLTVPRNRMADIKRITEDQRIDAFPVSSDFKGSPDDESIVLTYMVPFQNGASSNLKNLELALQSEKIPTELAVASNRPVVVRTKGNGLNIIGPDFSETKQLGKPPFTRRPIEPALQPETGYASQASYESAKAETTNIPRQGGCTYMLLEDNFVDKIQKGKDEDLSRILRQISQIFSAPNFHISRQGGFLVIVNTADRAGAYLTSLSMGLLKASGGHTKAIMGKGEVIHRPKGQGFEMKGFMATQEKQKDLLELEDGVYLSADMYDPALQRLKGRDGAQHLTTAAPHWSNKDLLQVKEHKPSVELKVGGPDKFIGYEPELTKFNSALTDTETKLIMIRASAGMGKTALLSEAEKTNPSMIVTTIDPSQSHVQGGGLVKIVEQITTYVENNLDPAAEEPRVAYALKAFKDQTEDKKISFAQRNPKDLMDMCIRALDFLREKLGPLKLVIDDVHHIDRHSDTYVMAMVGQLLSGEGKDKVVLSMRPEDRYKSEAQSTLEKQIRSQGEEEIEGEEEKATTVKVVTLTGLDFSDPEVAEEWIMHSLPAETTKGNHLAGDWWQKLGQKAGKFPLAMMTYMDEIMLERAKMKKQKRLDPLQVSGGEIRLSTECLNRLLKKIPTGGDLGIYYQEKQNKLPENLQTFMHCAALLGGAISEGQISVINQIIGQPGVTAKELQEVLLAGCYLVEGVAGKYRFKHQTISDSVLGSMNAERNVDLSTRLYLQFKDDRSINEETKLTLLHNVAPTVSEQNTSFWQAYSSRVRGSLSETSTHKSYGHGHALAGTVLGDIKGLDELEKEGKLTVIQQNLMRLRREPDAQVTEDMYRMIIESLAELGRDALMVGQFKESETALAIIEEIAATNPGLIQNLKPIYMLMLDLAYARQEGSKMRKIYEEKLGKGTALEPAERAAYDVQIAYMSTVGFIGGKPDLDAVLKAYEQNVSVLSKISRNPQDPNYGGYLEATRLMKGRVPFEAVRNAVVNREGGKKFDEDVMLQPKALTPLQMGQLKEIDQALKPLFESREKNPTAFSPYSEMGLLDLDAQVKAMLGKYPEAISAFSEYWRQANQMGIHREAARAAKMKGDVQMEQGLSRNQIDRERVLEAIKTYGEEGIKSLATLPDTEPYQFPVRVQRIRAIGILAESYLYEMETRKPQPKEAEQMHNALLDHVKEAFKDFDYINEKWPQYAADPEVQYYLMGYMGYVMQATKVFNITAPYIKNHPYVNAEALAAGQKYGNEIIVDSPDGADLKEKPRKLKGHGYMAQFV